MPASASKPVLNSYWVRPGQLLAGEYPLSVKDAHSATPLQNLLVAGINCFINLTAEGELPSYHQYLPQSYSGKPVVHHRFAIADHGVPRGTHFMSAILDVIDAALLAGHGVYVHCRAGIGRTGTVMGCHFVRHGYAGDAALAVLNKLWQRCPRAQEWPYVPETEQQAGFVRGFTEARSATPAPATSMPVATTSSKSALPAAATRLDAYAGVMLGLALGDVLGTAVPTKEPSTAVPDNLSASTHESVQPYAREWPPTISNLAGLPWSADTAMTLAVADSLLSCKQVQPVDQMQRYLAWQKQGRYSSHDRPGVLPPALHKALGLWQWKRNAWAGAHDPAQQDAHSLARCTAAVLYFAPRPGQAIREAAEVSRTSAQAPVVLDTCRVFAALLLSILDGLPLTPWLEMRSGAAFMELRALPLKPEVLNLIDGGWRTAMTHAAGEDVLSVLASAIHAIATTTNFQAAIFKAMHRAKQPATVGAVCGALAGARYGVQGLPLIWRETLTKANELLMLSEQLCNGAPI